MPKVYAYMTGERVTPESAAHGDADTRGWIDPSWSMREFLDSRNDVRPIVDEWMPHDSLPDVLCPCGGVDCADRDSGACLEALREIVRDALATLGAYEDNGDGTFYGVDAVDNWTGEDLENGWSYTYALHFYIKTGADERAWHPSEIGVTTS